MADYHILLVTQDNALKAEVVSILGASLSLEISNAVDGQTALEVFSEPPIDLIITEFESATMGGFQWMAKLRNTPGYNTLPILFVLANSSGPTNREKIFNLGATDYIASPLLPIELKTKVASYLGQQQARQQIETYHKQLDHELMQARNTQRSILPNLPDLPNVKMFTKYEFSSTISGDFYDVFDLRHGKIGILVADVTGHGISAALVSSMVAILFKTHSFNFNSTALTIQIVNDLLQDRLREDMYATVFYGIYDVKSHSITFTTAAHPPAYVLRTTTNEIIPLSTRDTLLGAFPSNFASFTEANFELLPGDKLFLYTDGLIERPNGDKNFFGNERLKSLLQANLQLPIEPLIETVYKNVMEFGDSQKFTDDLTILGLEILND